ncbi:type II toxin-antitoxin system HicA family toxin [Actinokineospora sp.]|uniref:type II toxin-antitoxin system HicA family toxin n=1 Tax=Actinokineospora sp. TaxID=1872133 RepID=UPI003D6A48E0
MKAREINRRIERLGGEVVRQTGSHRRYVAVYLDSEGVERKVFTIVAQHPGDIPIGTLRAIGRDMTPAFGLGWLG